MEIIDDLLPEKEFESISKLFMDIDQDFPWYYRPQICHNDGLFQFVHMFFMHQIGPASKYLPIWNNFNIKVGSNQQKVRRIKSNLTLRTDEPRPTQYHIDYEDIITAIFYINTNNGYTEFENGVRVDSVANRVCIFDSNLKHRGVSHTEGDRRRIVVNFNYER
tara:strand:+ start:33 stop:521 length:489 start_codon:yes stop_codon:yes gene_type:complete